MVIQRKSIAYRRIWASVLILAMILTSFAPFLDVAKAADAGGTGEQDGYGDNYVKEYVAKGGYYWISKDAQNGKEITWRIFLQTWTNNHTGNPSYGYAAVKLPSYFEQIKDSDFTKVENDSNITIHDNNEFVVRSENPNQITTVSFKTTLKDEGLLEENVKIDVLPGIVENNGGSVSGFKGWYPPSREITQGKNTGEYTRYIEPFDIEAMDKMPSSGEFFNFEVKNDAYDPTAIKHKVKIDLISTDGSPIPTGKIFTLTKDGESVKAANGDTLELYSGDYTVTSDDVPGYLITTQTVNVPINTSQQTITAMFKIKKEPLPIDKVTVTLKDLNTGEPIQGATFRITQETSTYAVGGYF